MTVSDIDPGSMVFLLAPSHSDADVETCLDLLTPTAPEQLDILTVSYTRTVEELADIWNRHIEAPPSSAAIVTPAMVPGEEPICPDVDEEVTDELAVETISGPSNLTQLGVRITEHLSARADDEGPVVMCFQSLSVLLQYVEPKQVTQFLHVLSGRVAAHDAIAHFHVDPAAHDEQTVRMLMQFCDEVVDRSEGGYS